MPLVRAQLLNRGFEAVQGGRLHVEIRLNKRAQINRVEAGVRSQLTACFMRNARCRTTFETIVVWIYDSMLAVGMDRRTRLLMERPGEASIRHVDSSAKAQHRRLQRTT
jgi:hypothetical protein